MSQKHLSRQRMICAAGITLALLGLASQSASAQEAQSNVQSTDSMTVVRDAATGKLRGATGEEATALKAAGAARAMRVAPKATQQKVHASGARGARLTDEFMSQSVAVRQPDGSVVEQCFDSHDAASNAVAAAHVHTNKVETE
ncbi:MAG: hypothetical protein M3Y65_25490 [Pseudomonadota bacterium]|nr:hypothetical protein [Pseudomonadota bacterium]